MLIITKASHIDHALDMSHIRLIFQEMGDATEFAIREIQLPDGVPSLPCGLRGPAVGGEPVHEDKVFYQKRAGRDGESRMVFGEPTMVRTMTVIVGPDDIPIPGQVVLYTVYGGPIAPREPWDQYIQGDESKLAESTAFWAQHALVKERKAYLAYCCERKTNKFALVEEELPFIQEEDRPNENSRWYFSHEDYRDRYNHYYSYILDQLNEGSPLVLIQERESMVPELRWVLAPGECRRLTGL